MLAYYMRHNFFKYFNNIFKELDELFSLSSKFLIYYLKRILKDMTLHFEKGSKKSTFKNL